MTKSIKLLVPAIVLALTTTVQAANLGTGRVYSRVGEPLRAEIALTGVTPAEAGTLRADIAPPDLFSASGLDYPAVLDSVKAQVVRSNDGYVIRLTSEAPVMASMLTPIIELSVNGTPQTKSVSLSVPGKAPGEAPSAAPAPASPSTLPPWPLNATPSKAAPVAAVPASAATPAPTVVPASPPPAAKAAASPTTPPPPAKNNAAAVAAATAALQDTIRQEVRAALASDSDGLKQQLADAAEKTEKLAGMVDQMSNVIAAQQKLIDAQNPQAAPAPAGAPQWGGNVPGEGASALPVVIERAPVDPWLWIGGAAVLVLAILATLQALALWRRGKVIYLPAPSSEVS